MRWLEVPTADPRRHARGSSSCGASSSRRRSSDPPTPTRFADFPQLPPLLQVAVAEDLPRRLTSLTWLVEITDQETHKRKWVGSFHTVELAATEYDRWQVRFHGREARLNFPFGTAPIHLVLPKPGVVSAAMARENQEARERLVAEAVDEAYMEDLCRQHPELVEAERAIFADNGREVIVTSDDEVQGSEEGGKEEEFDVEEWPSIFPDCNDVGTSPDPCLTEGVLSRKNWFDLHYGR